MWWQWQWHVLTLSMSGEWYDSLVLQKEPRRIETDYNREGLKKYRLRFFALPYWQYKHGVQCIENVVYFLCINRNLVLKPWHKWPETFVHWYFVADHIIVTHSDFKSPWLSADLIFNTLKGRETSLAGYLKVYYNMRDFYIIYNTCSIWCVVYVQMVGEKFQKWLS